LTSKEFVDLRYIKAIAKLSRFIATQSRRAGNESNTAIKMNQLRAAVGVKPVILVVDDDSAVRGSLKFALEVDGFEVRAYSSAHELLNNDSLPPASCLVTDYHMPAMNGLELVAQLRDRRVSIPAILITSLPNENLRNRAAAAGISIVEKPVLGSSLVDSIYDASLRPAFAGEKGSPCEKEKGKPL
jgi:CheY-like chemotaxis protein